VKWVAVRSHVVDGFGIEDGDVGNHVGRRMPRSKRPTRLAVSEVIFRTASSRRMVCCSRTYSARMQGKVPKALG
jgi:hypothetical protein